MIDQVRKQGESAPGWHVLGLTRSKMTGKPSSGLSGNAPYSAKGSAFKDSIFFLKSNIAHFIKHFFNIMLILLCILLYLWKSV